ncbi:MAG TPA: response regulator [Polyangia bacterium]
MMILVVEDDEGTAILHRRALERAGHHVIVATGIDDARHYLDEIVFDVVLSDFNLSENENGAELLLEVRCRSPLTRRVLYSNGLPWRMKLAAQAVAHSVIDGVRASEDLVSALAA